MKKIQVGIAENALTVPLFTELYGYGPFLGRRNRGTHDPLYCRAITFFDGKRRNLLIVSDACVTNQDYAHRIRRNLSQKLGIEPSGIFMAGTHTHSGPAMANGIGWGAVDEHYLRHWARMVQKTAAEALTTEEPVEAFAGRAPLSMHLSYNRTNPIGESVIRKRLESGEDAHDDDNWPTDPEIRWVQLKRKDGSVKVLIHNYGMHGVVGGGRSMYVSADWMGEANRLIKERKLADTPFFIYGAAGDINSCPIGKQIGTPEGNEALAWIGRHYVDDLQASIAKGGHPIELAPLQNALESVQMPTIHEDSAQLLANAELVRKTNGRPFLADRYEEMALLYDMGKRFEFSLDLQVLRMGELAVYAFPGEPFFELGRRVMEGSPYSFALPAGVANGNGRYFPTKKVFDRFKNGLASENRSYGFYEIYQGCGAFMPPYQSNVADFIVGKLLKMNVK